MGQPPFDPQFLGEVGQQPLEERSAGRGDLDDEADLAQRFGAKIARIVADCSDSEGPEKKPPWRARKERYLAHLATSDGTSALVAAADKLHNARRIVPDLERYGQETLDRFNGRRGGTLWYFQELAKLFRRLDVPPRLRDELGRTVRRMAELA